MSQLETVSFPSDYRPLLRREMRLKPTDPPQSYVLYDASRIGKRPLVLSDGAAYFLRHLDGRRTIDELLISARNSGIKPEQIRLLVAALDQALFLESPTLEQHLLQPNRPASCIGCYPAEASEIPDTLLPLFTATGGPGLPQTAQPASSRLRAVLVPHMDYARGGVTYGWGFTELLEKTSARLFVIIGTSHYSQHRFTLTRMNFETPLGVVPTDQNYIDQLVAHYGDGLFADRIAHFPEHSIELEVVLLQFLLKERGPFRIVPLLVGSFFDRVEVGADPLAAPDIRRMVDALRSVESSSAEEVCYIISGDLAHIGPKFHNGEDSTRFTSSQPVEDSLLTESRRRDEELLEHLTSANHDRYFDRIAEEQDERNICGLPPTWLTLAATRPKSGRVLHYSQYVDPKGAESVSFAAAAFYE